MLRDLKIRKQFFFKNPGFFCKTQGFLVSLGNIIKKT